MHLGTIQISVRLTGLNMTIEVRVEEYQDSAFLLLLREKLNGMAILNADAFSCTDSFSDNTGKEERL